MQIKSAGLLMMVYWCSLFAPMGLVWADEVSCDCPTLGCDPCGFSKGLTFYTEKCGPKDSKLKSCGRPTCMPIESATQECPVPPKADAGPREPIVISNGPAKANAADDVSAGKIGTVKVIKGSVSVVDARGNSSVIGKEAIAHEGDTVTAGGDGAALVSFEGGNKMHVHPDTEVKIKEFKEPKDSASRKALFQLIKGKIRNQVEQKYKNNKTSYFKIETRGAVAGVRGTDFVISHALGAQMETRVEALEGRVELGGQGAKELREINRGEGATFTTKAPQGKDKNLEEFFEGGVLSPVYKISADKLRELEWDSRVDVARNKKKSAPAADEICDKPKARFNQCSWQKAGADCVRKRCNGNGKWAEETKLPAATASVCPASAGPVVKDCDY